MSLIASSDRFAVPTPAHHRAAVLDRPCDTDPAVSWPAPGVVGRLGAHARRRSSQRAVQLPTREVSPDGRVFVWPSQQPIWRLPFPIPAGEAGRHIGRAPTSIAAPNLAGPFPRFRAGAAKVLPG